MPPLTNLMHRVDADPQWKTQVDSVSVLAERIATSIPLVHVLGRSEPQRLTVRTVFSQNPPRIPLSQERLNGQVVCGPGASFVETQLCDYCGLEQELQNGVVYCYVGRARNDYGAVAIALFFDSQSSTEFELGGFPFDSGAILKDIPFAATALEVQSIPKDDIPLRRKFLIESLSVSPWRADFAKWLAAYFSHEPESYWTGAPSRIDPEELYRLNPNSAFRAESTWEVLIKRTVPITDCKGFCADIAAGTELRELLTVAVETNPGLLAELVKIRDLDLNKLEPVSIEHESHCLQLENWIRTNAFSR